MIINISKISLCILMMSCNTEIQEKGSEYDFGDYKKIVLPNILEEVSGISIDAGFIYAVQDEKGSVFKVSEEGEILQEVPFAKAGDYEEIVRANSLTYILRSDGMILSFESNENLTKTDELPKGEYETMFLEPASQRLNILCKACKKESDEYTIKGFSFDVNDLNEKPEEFEFKLPKEKQFKKAFAASAAAQNPITEDIYIISAIRSQLLIFDKSHTFKKSVPLRKKMFPQPEGITFDPDGNLYISNEGGESSKPNIIRFNRID
ncbi:SdiA-regulated domain-containing protein [Arcticibacterium luteifluviistationis]|uniref:SdiA-regulated family protein n=1 Tax=Arcticibacterium luteifluviistationis TaxID=1784714 RepID=A0A2Z4G7W9_9BACT|nr:SdiA-regulated domain-containing protein [Arcticibacterium luteifluviistationis]AWV97153.1 hypothetical protein DJ013_02770 [Arcticibacterium luteifluviistationis]